MGQRANMVLVEQGDWSLFYDHWCANRLDDELFWGPALAREFVTQRDPVPRSQWLDDVWCEGAAVLDFDKQHLLWFGGEDVSCDRAIRRAWFELATSQWTGWTVEWALHGIEDIATYVGVPVEHVRSARTEDAPVRLHPIGDVFCELTLVSARVAGQLRCVAADGELASLAGGNDALDELRFVERSGFVWDFEQPESGVHIDFDHNELCYWSTGSVSGRLYSDLAAGWPGWSIRRLASPDEHAALSGVPFTASIDPRAVALDYLKDLRRRCHSPASNPAAALAKLLGATHLSPATEETRGAAGDKPWKQSVIERLEAGLDLGP